MRKIILTLLLVMMSCYGWSQQYRYVKAGATGSGTSWSNASGDLQAMINASAAGDEVWVAEGTYQPAAGQWFSMKEGVKIYGGFPANNDNAALGQRNWALHPTILKGNGHSVIRNVFTSGNKMTNASVLDGFTVRDGLYYGAGSSYAGGGIYNQYASPTLRNLIVRNNRAYAGGGIMCLYSSPIIINSLITANTGNIGKGVMSDKGGVHMSNPLVINSTIIKNGNEILVRGAKITFQNSVVYGTIGYSLELSGGSSYTAFNTYIKGKTTTDAYGNIDGSIDPSFTNYAAGDYSPSVLSPLVDAGKNSYYNGSIVDIRGEPRIYGSRIDIGTYEFQGVSCTEVVWDGTSWSGPTGLDKHLIINGTLAVTSDLEGCSMTINSGNVYVYVGKTIRLLNDVKVLGGSLYLNHSTNLVQINDVVNTGNIIVNVTTKPMDKSNHGYWSSPVAGYKMNQFSPNTPTNSYYSWNLSSQGWTTHAGGDVVMQAGHGYLMRAPMSNTPVVYNMSFNGIPNNGEVTRAIQGGGKWNYLGNPYPSAINIDAFLYDPANSGLDKLVYLWTNGYKKEGGNYVYQWEGFATYNAVGGVGTPAEAPGAQQGQVPTKYIASGQAFFIPGNANGQAVFKNSHRVIGNNTNSFNREKPVDRYWLDLISQDNRYGQTLVGYLEDATNGRDKDIDAPPFLSGQETIELYTILDQERFIIQGRAPFEQEDIVALGYTLAEAGTYTLKLSGFEGLFVNGQEVYLYDKALQLSHNLKEADYSFTTEAGVHEDRFEITYTQREGVSPASFDANWVAFNKNGQLRIESTADFNHIRIYDLVGRMIYDKAIVPASAYEISGLDQNQILILKVGFENQTESTKKIKY
ncbi:MAG TPA: choice-of-anchor Q domain-containing protein [Flavobacterium sp.]|nr:choice-of-anchor Q domain-containing protein [Flavobacterium sp.]